MQYGADNTGLTEAEGYGSGASGASAINIRHYWYVLLERRWLVICAYLAVLTLAGVYLYTAPKIYEATSRLQIDPESESSLNLRDVVVRMGGGMDQGYLQTQYKNLVSRHLLLAVAKKEHLDQDPRYAKRLDVAQALADDIAVTPIRMTRLVDVSVEHTSAQKAASLANTLVNEFIDWMASARQERTASMLFFLRNQAAGLEGEVTKAEEDLHNYRLRTKYVSLEKGDSILAEAMAQAQASYVTAKSRAEVAQTTVNVMTNHVAAGKSLESFPAIAGDSQIRSLQGQLITLENETRRSAPAV